MKREHIAAICHEANASLCAAYGDFSQAGWGQAPAWQRESAVAGVTFAAANPDAPTSAQHDSWMAAKDADGWEYGPVKDAEAKTHPCMVPYEQLPAEQQAKDHLFKAICKALLPFAEG